MRRRPICCLAMRREWATAGSPAAACGAAPTCGASWTGSPVGGLLAMMLLLFERCFRGFCLGIDPVTHHRHRTRPGTGSRVGGGRARPGEGRTTGV